MTGESFPLLKIGINRIGRDVKPLAAAQNRDLPRPPVAQLLRQKSGLEAKTRAALESGDGSCQTQSDKLSVRSGGREIF